jgi:GH15 family glucan-1,4-alpha-glucosidase
MCWVALDRALRLAESGHIPARDASLWRAEAKAVREFVDGCFSPARNSYVMHPGREDLDARLLLGVIFAYGDPHDPRLASTVEAIEKELVHGPFVSRYTASDGLPGTEGAFLACSFWLVEALALLGRHADATTLMEELLGVANDVGLYSEELDRDTGEFLGNFPQGLTHLGLINAAVALRGGDHS